MLGSRPESRPLDISARTQFIMISAMMGTQRVTARVTVISSSLRFTSSDSAAGLACAAAPVAVRNVANSAAPAGDDAITAKLVTLHSVSPESTPNDIANAFRLVIPLVTQQTPKTDAFNHAVPGQWTTLLSVSMQQSSNGRMGSASRSSTDGGFGGIEDFMVADKLMECEVYNAARVKAWAGCWGKYFPHS